MCGRFVRISPYMVVAGHFGLTGPEVDLGERFNLAPGQEAAAVIADAAGRRLAFFRWGFVPAWSKGRAKEMINARAETLSLKPSFREAFRKRRCLVVADGFFEWSGVPGRKPHFITLAGGRPFGMAGIFETFLADGTPRSGFALITVPANSLIAPFHNRMPAIIPAEAQSAWLDCAGTAASRAESLLQPCPAAGMSMHEVSSLVNSPLHDSPECIRPVDSTRALRA